MMETPHRITYRFNSIGEKIDESNEVVSEPKTEVKFENERKFDENRDLDQLVQLEQLEQLIRNSEFRNDVDQGENETLQEDISYFEATNASDVVGANEQDM